ncbi:MAG: hypothetical protein J6H31_10125 [Butyrivibrio sp.]|nr:hypothetical protein [Butyrivibrio sp.]
MLMPYVEAVKEYGTGYKLKKAVEEGRIYKVSPGIYARQAAVSDMEKFQMKYKTAIFTMDSAFYFLGLTDVVPEKWHIATARNSTRLPKDNVQQYFEAAKFYGIGKSIVEFNGAQLRCYDQERMLLELVRRRKTMPFDLYKEIVQSYRQRYNNIDYGKLDDYIEEMQCRTDFYDIIQREIL